MSILGWGGRDSAVVKVLVFNQCGSGSDLALLQCFIHWVLQFSSLHKNQDFQIPITFETVDVCLSVCLAVCIYLFIYLFTYLLTCLFIYLFIYSFIYLFIYLFVLISVCIKQANVTAG